MYIGRNKRGTTKIPSAYTDDTSFLTRIHDLASNLRPNNSKTRSKRFHNNLHLPLSLFREITFVLLLFFVYVNYYIHFLKTCKMKLKLFYIYLQTIKKRPLLEIYAANSFKVSIVLVYCSLTASNCCKANSKLPARKLSVISKLGLYK